MSKKPHPIAQRLGYSSPYSAEVALINAGICGKGPAKLLCQIGYWSDKGSDPQGWIHKSLEDWAAETGIAERTLREHFKALSGVCVERRVGKSKFYKGRTVVICRIHWGKFDRACQVAGLLDANGKPLTEDAPVRRKPTPRPKQAEGKTKRATSNRHDSKSKSGGSDVMNAEAQSAVLVKEVTPSLICEPAVRAGNRSHPNASETTSPSSKPAGSRRPEKLTAKAIWEAIKATTRFQFEMSRLVDFGYDEFYNPPDARTPAPGEPESILRRKYGKIQFPLLLEVWLHHGAMEQPVLDIEWATQVASPARPEDVERFAGELLYRRITALSRKEPEHWKHIPENRHRLPAYALRSEAELRYEEKS